ncbi:claudin-like protein ZF-A89 [Hippocampus zosterae]|uniref:claudin-like protein ZF-A89 n=1 Tax=Hippocampus zosterae TaxID=109293 RepID=UPI00223C97A4|nr:claudin-like protein ZF-A89 [Hippocampus zosterae]
MSSAGPQLTAAFLLTAGLAGAIVTCALPMWKVSAFVGNNIVTAQTFWEGLWMSCAFQSTGQMQCKLYDSALALPRHLQAARAMTVAAILLAAAGLPLAFAGGECTNCPEEKKARAAAAAGALAAAAGALLLVPASWSAHDVVRDFYDPALGDAQRRELGAALFVGWASAGLLLIGGALLCRRRRRASPRDASYSVKYSAAGGAAYV